jgi:hypothetical protein
MCLALCCVLFGDARWMDAQSYYGSLYQPNRGKPFSSATVHSQSSGGYAKYQHPTRDLYNKYFYQSPAVSPYLNMTRPNAGGATTAYHAFVRPEQQRRERSAQQQSAYIADRKRQTSYPPGYGAGGRPNLPAPKPRANAYYNQWYGGR